MSLLLAADEVTLYPPSVDTDEHGWRLPDTSAPYWSGLGNLQLQPGVSVPTAADGGGRGPYGPARDQLGVLFLPASIPALFEGSTAVVGARTYVLSQTRVVNDPLDGATLTCWAATATSVDTWPGFEPIP